MPQFKRVITQLLRFSPKSCQPLRKHCEIDSPVNPAVTHEDLDWQPEPAHVSLEPTVQPSTDTVTEEVEEDEHDEHDDEDEDKNVLETLPRDLLRNTLLEQMMCSLYVAVADNDSDIAALCAQNGKRFTHVVRVAFATRSPDDDTNIAPSSWTWEVIRPEDGPSEFRLTCPELASRISNCHTALTAKQLVAARDYITRSLPERNDRWEEEGLKFPLTPEQCKDARMLIVGPSDRSVDVMAIFICYFAFLSGSTANYLLEQIRKNCKFVHSHWLSEKILRKNSLVLVDVAARQRW